MKRLLSILLAIVMLLTCVPLSTLSASAEASGTTGDCAWVLDTDGHLTISGHGAMGNYDWDGYTPWSNSAITSVTVEENITTIGNYAFSWQEGLTSLTIPSSVTAIGEGAFYYCTSLKSITIPSNVTTIGDNAFAFCNSLTDVYYEGSESDRAAITIGSNNEHLLNATWHYEGCTGVFDTPCDTECNNCGVIRISSHAYDDDHDPDCNLCGMIRETLGLIYEMANNEITIIGYNSALPSNLTIPATIEGYPVTKIGYMAFDSCTTLASVIIPNSVITMGMGAFSHCSSLTSVIIPESITNIKEDTFSFCSSLTSITIPDSITAINDWAFDHCDSLTDVYYGGNASDRAAISVGIDNDTLLSATWHYAKAPDLEIIGSGTTGSCNWTLYENGHLTISGNGAMGSYVLLGSFLRNTPWGTEITSVTIENGVTDIGAGAFHDCSSLTSITIPDTVTAIGASAFRNCSALQSVTIPDGITSISSYTFYGCSALQSVTIPDGVTSIGAYAFRNCSSLQSVTIPINVITIGNYTFYGCASLQSVTIPDNVTSIGTYAFYGCSALQSVTIPDTVTSIGEYALYGCSNLEWITVAEDNAYYCSVDDVLFNKAMTTLIKYPSKKAAASYSVPESVTTIEIDAFRDNRSLISVTIPDSVTAIKDYTFYGCSALQSITLRASSVGENAFYACDALTDVYYNGPESRAESMSIGVGNDALRNAAWHYPYVLTGTTGDCTWILEGTHLTISGNGAMGLGSPWGTDITSVIIEDGITNVGMLAFYNCSGLTSVTIPDSVTSIEAGAFYYCSSLESIIIPDSVITIGNSAFERCHRLESVIIPDSTTTIEETAFRSCSDLQSVTIGAGVTSIGEDAFDFCNNIAAFTVAQDNTYYCSLDGVLFNKDMTALIKYPAKKTDTSYSIPEGVTTIANDAFYYCRSLISVTIPDSVAVIGEWAFYLCDALTSVAIPDSVTSVGQWAFANCSSLISVTIPDSVTVIAGRTFAFCDSLTTVAIGAGSTTIESDAFYSCGSLVAITIAEDNTHYCSVDGVLFNKDMTTLIRYPVKKATLSYSIPESVTAIADYAFEDNAYLESIIVPFRVTTIGSYAFSDCSSLQSITIPDNVTAIAAGTFTRCNALITVTIGDSVTTIGAYAFSNCNTLSTIIIPKSVTTIEYNAFDYCDALTDVYYSGNESNRSAISIDSYNDSILNATWHYNYAPEKIDLSLAALQLEYTHAYYKGVALTPCVTLVYKGQSYDPSKELKITYSNNNQVGTATVTVKGIKHFTGTAQFQFDITYESFPKPIVNVIAIGEIGKISLSWGESSEVNTDRYRIYRKEEGTQEFQLIKTVTGRLNLSYEDTDVEKGKIYSYYVTGLDIYGAEGEPSAIVTATVAIDGTAPVILKVSPAATSVISGKTTLSAIATDNASVTKVAYFYALDGSENWAVIGETSNNALSIAFDTTSLDGNSVKVRAIAYDAEGNQSAPVIVSYSLDNIGPDKVTGISAVALSSKITLSWNDVTANDAAYFILQVKSGEQWTNVATNIKTLGYTITKLQPNTDYLYRVACVDTHGNVGTYSDVFVVKTAIDESAPVITSQRPNSARYNQAIAFSAVAKDDCDIQSIAIQVSADLSQWTTISTKTYIQKSYTQTYAYTIDLSMYESGSLYVRAIATDFSGNISDTSNAAPYTEYVVDKTAPNAPTNVVATGNDGYITVSWSMGTESDLGKYLVYRSTSIDGNYQLIASNLASLNYHDRNVQRDSEYYYKVAVSDSCGNMSAYSDTVSASMSLDTKAPEITSISKTYEQKISNSAHTINVAATDNNKLASIVVEYCIDNNPEYALLTATHDINNHYKNIAATLPIHLLSDGDKIYLRAYAVDTSGKCSAYATATYTMDATPPTVDKFTVILENETVSLSWADAGESDLSGFKVYRAVNGGAFALIGSRSISKTGTYNFVDTITAKESNAYIYKLEAVDRLGNTASWLRTVNYTYTYINKRPIAKMDIPTFMTVDVEDIFDGSNSSDDMAIVSYLWDFGDGTTSTKAKPIKSYATAGKYLVTLSVADNEGVSSTVQKEIEVKEREILGTLSVKVVDEKNKALAYVPVYFDLGNDLQKVVYTNASGAATLSLPSGTHTIGMYATGYLPVKKEVVVLANATRTVTLVTVAEEIVTGNFEITRMTFEEIVAAGIDIYNPANQNVYSATVKVTYGSSKPLTINYVRNDEQIISYGITDSNGKPVAQYTNTNGETRKITGVTYIPSKRGNSDIVAIIDIPAEVSFLKEFFDVRLHIINNASSEFVLEKNEIVLNVPEGMTLMSAVGNGYATTNTVKVEEIRGQETVTIAWVLRGDQKGDYNLSADFTGTLAEFNELVTARFKTEEPIRVYGLDGIKFRVLIADEIHSDTLYFKVELENKRAVDIHMPSMGVVDNKIANIVHPMMDNQNEKNLLTQAFILNAYIQTSNGEKSYLNILYDANQKPYTNVKVLAPGQKLVYEYVAYNAINYDGVAYLQEAVITEFDGLLEDIEVASYTREPYSFTDYSEKLDNILSGAGDAWKAYQYIHTGDHYYYVGEAEKFGNAVLEELYEIFSIVTQGDLSHLTQDEQRALIEQIILTILSDSSAIQAANDLVNARYYDEVSKLFQQMEATLLKQHESNAEQCEMIASFCGDLLVNNKEMAIIYREKGFDALLDEIVTRSAGYGIGLSVEAISDALSPKDAFMDMAAWFGFATDAISGIYDAISDAERDAMYFSILKYQCNVDVSRQILDALIAATEKSALDFWEDAVTKGLLMSTSTVLAISSLDLTEKELIYVVAKKMRNNLDKNVDDYSQSLIEFGKQLKEVTLVAVKTFYTATLQTALKSTPYGLVALAIASGVEKMTGWGDYVSQQDTMQVYNELSIAFGAAFIASTANRNLENDLTSMWHLRALCEMRLMGESTFKEFLNNYATGHYVGVYDEEDLLKKINKAKNTSYQSLEEWWDAVQYGIIRSTDILFNTEGAIDMETPEAPSVSLDYDTLQTYEDFTSEYEYCFADGVWVRCDGGPISFELGSTPSTLRVRKAASATNFAGEITTVTIFAQKELNQFITVKYDGTGYLFSHLSEDRCYQVLLTNDVDAPLDWSLYHFVSGSVPTLYGVDEYDYVVIRSCHDILLQETVSHPLRIIVNKKKPLNLMIVGGGTVTQTSNSGYYFDGDSIDLVATANPGYEFAGWYINDAYVSTDTKYIVEMADGLQVVAQFTVAEVVASPVAFVGNSISEDVNGLAFKFDVTATGGQVKNGNQYVSGSAQIVSSVDGQLLKLIRMGAIVSNKEQDILSLENVNNKTIIDVKAIRLCELSEISLSFAIRVINIPDKNKDSMIYVRPYYIYECNSEEIIVYDDIVSRTYNSVLAN